MPDKELRLRVITAVGIGAVIIGATLGGVLTSYVLLIIIITGSSIEFFRMQKPLHGNQNINVPVFLSTAPVVTGIIAAILDKNGLDLTWSEWIVASCIIAFGLYFFTQMRTEVVRLERRLFMFSTSLILFTLPGFFAVYICDISPILLLGIFILIWSSDIFAYFGGRAFGKHKLLPSVSPKKTWEGFFCGLIAAALAAWGLSYLFTETTTGRWIVTALLVVIFGTSGDLLESVFKRSAGVKDSGALLPGHGGLWDRFDSFLGCLPWVGVYYLLM